MAAAGFKPLTGENSFAKVWCLYLRYITLTPISRLFTLTKCSKKWVNAPDVVACLWLGINFKLVSRAKRS